MLVGCPVSDGLTLDSRFQNTDLLLRRIPGKKERADARSQKMVWTAGAERGQFFGPLRSGKCQHILMVGIRGDHTAIRGHDSPERGQDLRGNVLAILRWSVFDSPQ